VGGLCGVWVGGDGWVRGGGGVGWVVGGVETIRRWTIRLVWFAFFGFRPRLCVGCCCCYSDFFRQKTMVIVPKLGERACQLLTLELRL
jgi:hypothetical protein